MTAALTAVTLYDERGKLQTRTLVAENRQRKDTLHFMSALLHNWRGTERILFHKKKYRGKSIFIRVRQANGICD
jgi:hypothetical protein